MTQIDHLTWTLSHGSQFRVCSLFKISMKYQYFKFWCLQYIFRLINAFFWSSSLDYKLTGSVSQISANDTRFWPKLSVDTKLANDTGYRNFNVFENSLINVKLRLSLLSKRGSYYKKLTMNMSHCGYIFFLALISKSVCHRLIGSGFDRIFLNQRWQT